MNRTQQPGPDAARRVLLWLLVTAAALPDAGGNTAIGASAGFPSRLLGMRGSSPPSTGQHGLPSWSQVSQPFGLN